MRKAVIVLAVLLIMLPLLAVSCSSPEKTARDGIATMNGYLVSARARHSECDPDKFPGNQPQSQCQVIRRGTQANNLAIDALEVFCGGPAFNAGTGACQAPNKGQPAFQQGLDKLNSALVNLNTTASDVRALTK